MSVYRVKTSISGVFTNMDLLLHAKKIMLSYDGNESYQSTDLFDLSSPLVLQWIGIGLSYQTWNITLLIAAQKPDNTFDVDKKWTMDGSIPPDGGSQLYKSIDISTLKDA